jgi:UDP-N-acetylmuramoyl-L-alanyl-D-glutamate--2,6-diaminopimelate ligase
MLLGDLLSVAWASDRVRLVRPSSAWSSIRICDLTEDSRTVVPGSLFVARSGASHDGCAFLEDAIDAGAAAVLVPSVLVEADDAWMTELLGRVVVIAADDPGLESAHLAERFYGRPTDRLAVVGVTGTNGKSTVAHITQQLLARRGSPCGLIGTIEIDDGSERVASSLTTPPAIELSRTFGVMLESGCKAAAMEVSSHALAQGARGRAVRFAAAVFTNLGTDHVDYHGSVEAYLDAKLGLFRMLGPGGVAVVNVDDPHAGRCAQRGRARWPGDPVHAGS